MCTRISADWRTVRRPLCRAFHCRDLCFGWAARGQHSRSSQPRFTCSSFGYRLFGDGLFHGAALGKRLFRIRVVDAATRQPCSVGQSAIRMGVLFLPFVPIVPIIELIFLAVERQQRWGDQLARTYVLRSCPEWAPEVARPLRPMDFDRLRETLDTKDSH